MIWYPYTQMKTMKAPYEIIDAQGGQLDFNPKEKKGSSILFTLPLFPNHLQDKYKLLKL